MVSLVFGAHTYAPDIARFWQPDPMLHNYHWLSPYAYCGGDPVNFIDPNGMQRYYVGMDGRIIPEEEARRIKDLGHYAEPLPDNDQIVIINEKGIVDASDMFDAGTIKFAFTTSISNMDINFLPQFTDFVISGDEAAMDIFKFLANNITKRNGIEFGLNLMDEDPGSSTNDVFTGHTVAKLKHSNTLYNYQKVRGRVFREFYHSHKNDQYPSRADYEVASYRSSDLFKHQSIIPVHKIYLSKTGLFYYYNEYSAYRDRTGKIIFR